MRYPALRRALRRQDGDGPAVRRRIVHPIGREDVRQGAASHRLADAEAGDAADQTAQLLEGWDPFRAGERDLADLRADLPLDLRIRARRRGARVRIRPSERIGRRLGPGFPGVEHELHRLPRCVRRLEREGRERSRAPEIVCSPPPEQIAAAEDERSPVVPCPDQRNARQGHAVPVEPHCACRRVDRPRERAADQVNETVPGTSRGPRTGRAAQAHLRRGGVHARSPGQVTGERVENEAGVPRADLTRRAQVGEPLLDVDVDLFWGLEHGALPERVADRLGSLELQDQDVRERGRPVDDEHQTGNDEGGLGQCAPALFSVQPESHLSATGAARGAARPSVPPSPRRSTRVPA